MRTRKLNEMTLTSLTIFRSFARYCEQSKGKK